MKKRCYSCKKVKELKAGFYKNKAQPSGYSSNCKECSKTYSDSYYINNKETISKRYKLYNKKNKFKHKSYRLFKKYGLTLKNVKDLLVKQNKECKICSVSLTSNSVKVDHCHKTGKVRGLLCSNCNVALGLFKDSITSLKKAIKYLKK